jgi:spore coat polysaccharide biosynthesis predicted glycosyltransferase SpsG
MNMPEVLRGAKLAVTAGGTTLYELASLGVPMVMLAIAENQRPTCERFAVADAAGYAGWYGELTPARLVEEIMVYWTEPELLRTLATRARSLVDGRGAARVVAAMTGGAR